MIYQCGKDLQRKEHFVLMMSRMISEERLTCAAPVLLPCSSRTSIRAELRTLMSPCQQEKKADGRGRRLYIEGQDGQGGVVVVW